MSEPCTCPLAGWCNRHNVDKPKVWHQLCQTRDNYRKAWDNGRGPGQPTKPLTPAQFEKQQRVKESRKRTDRLIGWLTFFRHPDEQGVGDTAERLNMRSCKSPDAHALIKRLMCTHSCTSAIAVSMLNREYPYRANKTKATDSVD